MPKHGVEVIAWWSRLISGIGSNRQCPTPVSYVGSISHPPWIVIWFKFSRRRSPAKITDLWVAPTCLGGLPDSRAQKWFNIGSLNPGEKMLETRNHVYEMVLKKNKWWGNGRCLRRFKSAVHIKISDKEKYVPSLLSRYLQNRGCSQMLCEVVPCEFIP